MAPHPVLLPGESQRRGSLVGCRLWGRTESDMTDRLHFHFSLSCTGEGNGNPLQCSCLENPRDGGAWWLALKGKDVALLGAQLRYVMPLGFLLMLFGGFFAERGSVRALLHTAVRLPSVLFFALTVVGMIAMVVCAKKFDRYDVRGNWIEQGINAAAQACAMIGALLL